MHPAIGDQGEPVDGRHRPEGQGPLEEAGEPGDTATATATAATAATDALTAAAALGRRLGHRAVDEYVAGQPGPHGQAGGDEGAHLARPLPSAVVPVEPQPQRVLHLGTARAGEPRGAGSHPRIGGQPVDVVAGEAGVVHGGQARLDGEVQVAPVQGPAHGRLADAGDHGAAFEWFFDGAHDPVPPALGRNRGRYTSSFCSKTTSMAMPSRTSSSSTSTRLVVRRTLACSSMATSPIR